MCIILSLLCYSTIIMFCDIVFTLLDGGPICKKDVTIEQEEKSISHWWVVLGGAVVGAAVIGIGIKVMSNKSE